MKPVLYRIETYVVPETENLSVINKIDNLMLANIKNESIFENNNNEKDPALTSHNKYEELVKFSAENSKLIGVKIVKGTSENETTRDERLDDDIIKYYNDENFCCFNERMQKPEFQASIGPQEALYPVKHFSRINSLVSIDERSENSLDTKLNDFCRHGYKNGCTASIQSPEEVSEEVFQENWLHKIEILRHRETILRERETNLQKRERELFRKEKELRIMERMYNDKMRQIDLMNEQLQHQKDTLVVKKRLDEVARILSDDVEKSDNLAEEKILRKEDISNKMEIPKKEEIPRQVEIPRKEEILKKTELQKKEEILRKTEIPKKTEMPKKEEILKRTEISRQEEITRKAEKNPVNPPIVNPSIINSHQRKEYNNKKLARPTRLSSSSRKSFSKYPHLYATVRCRERPKKIYDDLSSTLSATSVDSPNTRTSILFNPAQYQNPFAFTRSASERWPKHVDASKMLQKVVEEKPEHVDDVGKLQRVIEERPEHMIEEEKIFRKVSDNICALQKKETRFQDYGLVDCIPSGISSTITQRNSNERLSSYLDLEVGEKHSYRNVASVSKDRPVSWASKTSEWQQNKSQDCDLATKQPVENKENSRYTAKKIETKNTKLNAKSTVKPNVIPTVNSKTKLFSKSKKFFLFR